MCYRSFPESGSGGRPGLQARHGQVPDHDDDHHYHHGDEHDDDDDDDHHHHNVRSDAQRLALAFPPALSAPPHHTTRTHTYTHIHTHTHTRASFIFSGGGGCIVCLPALLVCTRARLFGDSRASCLACVLKCQPCLCARALAASQNNNHDNDYDHHYHHDNHHKHNHDDHHHDVHNVSAGSVIGSLVRAHGFVALCTIPWRGHATTALGLCLWRAHGGRLNC